MLSVERRYLYPQGNRSYRRGPSPRETGSGKKKKKKCVCRFFSFSLQPPFCCACRGMKQQSMLNNILLSPFRLWTRFFKIPCFLFLTFCILAFLHFYRTFKRIEKDIKLKRKLRENEMKSGIKVREMGETYVDKDRAIAVVIGNTKMTS